MVQTVLISIAAGIASAFLSGVLTPGSLASAMLVFIAPLPLMIVGLGWHPLTAALGALIAATCMSAFLGSKIALFYFLMIGLPAYLGSEGLIALMRRFSATVRTNTFGLVIGIFVLGAAAAYAALTTLVWALSIDTSYETFHSYIKTVLTEIFRALMGASDKVQIKDLESAISVYASMLPMFFTLVTMVMLLLSLWLAVIIVRKSERLSFITPPLFLTAMPQSMFFILIGALAVGRMPGYLGFIGNTVVIALTISFTLVGLAVIHMKTLGRPTRGFMLWSAWISMLFFGFPAFVFALVGILDTMFDFRRLRADGTPRFPEQH